MAAQERDMISPVMDAFEWAISPLTALGRSPTFGDGGTSAERARAEATLKALSRVKVGGVAASDLVVHVYVLGLLLSCLMMLLATVFTLFYIFFWLPLMVIVVWLRGGSEPAQTDTLVVEDTDSGAGVAHSV